MKRKAFLLFCLSMLLLFFSCSNGKKGDMSDGKRQGQPAPKESAVKGEPVEGAPIDYRISGPYTHRNLAVYLFHGEGQLSEKPIITLKEALEQQKAVLHETGNVGKLSIENLSESEEIFIQAGDIVKGGKQDRALAHSTVIPPKSGEFPLDSFCVEQGRWRQRGTESPQEFHSSEKLLSSSELKLAVKHSANQQDVWNEVGEVQSMLSHSIEASVQDPASTSSLQLTLDHEKVKKAVKEYLTDLSPLFEENNDLVGFAFAVNGKINSADLYNSRALFRKLRPKLLEASAAEAVAKLDESRYGDAPSIQVLKEWLREARAARSRSRQVDTSVHVRVKETASNVLYETLDNEMRDNLIHLGYISK